MAGPDGGRYTLTLADVAAPQLAAATAALTAPGFELREVVAGHALARAAYGARDRAPPGITVELDRWAPDTGAQRVDYYLWAADRAALEAYAAIALPADQLAAEGLRVAYQHQDPVADAPARWRSYLVREPALLDGTAIANAMPAHDPYSALPIVLLDFTREGGEAFAAITERHVGDKLAIMVGGEVRSAPVINGPIRGGRASIAMGVGAPEAQAAEAAALADVLRGGAVPPGGRIEAARVAPARVSVAVLWLLRLALGLLAGGVAFAIARALARRTTPIARLPGAPTRPAPWGALAVTGLAGIAVTQLYRVPLIGTSYADLAQLGAAGRAQVGAFALGLAPLFTAFLVVELAAAAIPAWRPARHTPRGRRRLGVATVSVAILLAVWQGFWVAQYLGAVAGRGLLAPIATWQALLVGLTLAAATLVLGVLAAVVSEHGLGNGFSVLLAAGGLAQLGRALDAERGAGGPAATTAAWIAYAALAVAMVCVIGWLVTRRIADRPARGDAGPSVPVAVAGILPLAWLPALGFVLVLAGNLRLDAVFVRGYPLVEAIRASAIGQVIGVVVLAAALGWLVTRPSVAAAIVSRIGGQPIAPARRAWALAVGASALALVTSWGLAAAARALPVPLGLDALAVGTLVACGLDVIGDWRARRRAELVGVWPIHSPQLVEAALDLLARARIPAHLRGRHHRALLSIAGPFVPIEVMVPPEHAAAATAILRDMFEPSARGVASAF